MMLKRLIFAAFLIAGVVAVLAVVGATWLIYQPVKADYLVYQRYETAVTADPAHATLYTGAYATFARLTRANSLHYAVHAVAARAAAATGHVQAATMQAHRAAFHRPARGGAITNLLVEMGHGVQRLLHRLI